MKKMIILIVAIMALTACNKSTEEKYGHQQQVITELWLTDPVFRGNGLYMSADVIKTNDYGYPMYRVTIFVRSTVDRIMSQEFSMYLVDTAYVTRIIETVLTREEADSIYHARLEVEQTEENFYTQKKEGESK